MGKQRTNVHQLRHLYRHHHQLCNRKIGAYNSSKHIQHHHIIGVRHLYLGQYWLNLQYLRHLYRHHHQLCYRKIGAYDSSKHVQHHHIIGV